MCRPNWLIRMHTVPMRRGRSTPTGECQIVLGILGIIDSRADEGRITGHLEVLHLDLVIFKATDLVGLCGVG